MATTNTSIQLLSNLLIPGYDKAVEFSLREMPTFRSIVDRRPVQVDNPGDTVYFTWLADLPLTTTPLDELASPDGINAANPSRTSVVVAEYGTWLARTLKLRTLAFTKIDWELAELLARQQGDTIDALVRAKMDTSSNVLGNNTTLFTSATVRTARTKMRSANVAFKDGSSYVAHVHPDITFDFMSETGTNTWHSPHVYGGSENPIYAGEVGKYSAIRFVENTRCKVVAAASGQAALYSTYVTGKQAMVEAVAIEPHTVVGEVVDPLKRFAPLGWYGMLGWNLFRPESLLVLKNKSSLNPALP